MRVCACVCVCVCVFVWALCALPTAAHGPSSSACCLPVLSPDLETAESAALPHSADASLLPTRLQFLCTLPQHSLLRTHSPTMAVRRRMQGRRPRGKEIRDGKKQGWRRLRCKRCAPLCFLRENRCVCVCVRVCEEESLGRREAEANKREEREEREGEGRWKG